MPLPPGQAAERLDLGREVQLTHLKVAQTYEGYLSRIVDVMNERFGLELGEADQLLFDQSEESWTADEKLAARARNNDFKLPPRLRPHLPRHRRQAHG